MRRVDPAIARAHRGGSPRPATFEQLARIRELAKAGGLETPQVAWYAQAEEALDRLERMVRKPRLW